MTGNVQAVRVLALRSLRGALLAGTLAMAWAMPAQGDVLVLQSTGADLYAQAARGLVGALPDGVAVRTDTINPDAPPEAAAAVVLPVGTAALQFALERYPDRPMLALLVPRRTFESLRDRASPRAAPLAALYLDQPLERQIRVARTVVPTVQRIGALMPDGTDPAAFSANPETLGDLVVQRVPHGKSPLRPLNDLAQRIDVLVAVPDKRLFNERTIHGILLSSYRYNIPVVGFSRAMVHAGALASAWLPPREHGIEAARMLAPYLAHTQDDWPESRYTTHFRIAVNEQVARSMGLRVQTAELEGRLFPAGGAVQ